LHGSAFALVATVADAANSAAATHVAPRTCRGDTLRRCGRARDRSPTARGEASIRRW
jgi:hypothetical protein